MGWLPGVLPPGIGEGLFAALLAASFAGSFITVAFGIGGGALMLAILAALMPPAALIPVHGVVQLGSNVFRATLLLRHIRWAALPLFVLGAVVGVALGGAIVVELPPGVVQVGVGLFVIWSVLARPPRWLGRMPWAAGAISSFLTMFFGATGVFVASYTKALNLPRHDHVATHAALMTCQHLLKVLVFGLLGFAFGPWAFVIAGMIGTGVLGTLAGRAVLARLSDVNFRRVLDAILLVISARLIWAGATGG
jgi:uncharacterized membrane protein YfcA